MPSARAALLAAAVVALAVPAVAAVGWTSGQPPAGANVAYTTPGHQAVFAGGAGTLAWRDTTAGSVRVSASADGGATWSAPAAPGGISATDTLRVGADASGNRVYAWNAGGLLRLARTGPSGLPTGTPTTVSGTSPALIDLAVNPAGDAVVAWASNGFNGEVSALFWPAGGGPGPVQPLATGAGLVSGVAAFLDPGRSGVVAFDKQGVWQSFASDAAAFGAAERLGDGSSVRGARAPDGRAVLAWIEGFAIPGGNTFGQTSSVRLWASARAPGQRLTTPQQILSNPDLTVVPQYGPHPGIGANGRAAILYTTQVNRTGNPPCTTTQGETRVSIATADVPATAPGAATFSAAEVAGGGTTNAQASTVAVGPDGRIGASWEAADFTCPTAAFRPVAAFAAPGAALAPVAVPPGHVNGLAFRPDGVMHAMMVPQVGTSSAFSGQLRTAVYDSGVPVAAPPATPPPPAAPGAPPAGPPAPPVAVALPPKVLRLAAGPAGNVTVVLKAELGDYGIDLLARLAGFTPGKAQKGRREAAAKATVIARAKVTVRRARTVTVVLVPNRTAKALLRRTGTLRATVRVRFTPAGGGKATTTTRVVTLRAAPVRRAGR